MTDRASLLATASRVIQIEARGLDQLAASMDESFARALDLILGAKGRVIVSGMGKSGHVGRKIAATLASTGTPAQFVHPAEASHGDLGMITEADVLLVLSNSGETPELSDIIAHSRRFAIPMIGVAGRAHSTLLQQSDVAILLPPAEEACGTGIVPTTSTTMTMALGDALAVALMEHRRFTADHFRTFHPGGKLGAKLLKVTELMHEGAAMPLVRTDHAMGDVLVEMSSKGFGVAGVVDGAGHLVGIVTDGDLRRHMGGLLEKSAAEVMTKNPSTIPPESVAEAALALMKERKITCLFVRQGNAGQPPLGILNIHDCLRAGVV
ncbi:MAG: KpsF/GutQ family sugar-phosphate isomerase [Paracoccaceae bacterium]